MSAEVVVIGAGVAGLSAATALAERGIGVHVLEARPAAGGRCSAFTDPVSGERVDNGQHVLFRLLRRDIQVPASYRRRVRRATAADIACRHRRS
jgi:phytoene dehydrogenase-like protein